MLALIDPLLFLFTRILYITSSDNWVLRSVEGQGGPGVNERMPFHICLIDFGRAKDLYDDHFVQLPPQSALASTRVGDSTAAVQRYHSYNYRNYVPKLITRETEMVSQPTQSLSVPLQFVGNPAAKGYACAEQLEGKPWNYQVSLQFCSRVRLIHSCVCLRAVTCRLTIMDLQPAFTSCYSLRL